MTEKDPKNTDDQVDDQNEAQFEEEEENGGGGGSSFFLYLFLLLFLLSTGLLVYTQFYQGDGKFNWSLEREGVSQYKYNELQEKYTAIQAEYDALKAEREALGEKGRTGGYAGDEDWMSGTVYEISIGTFRYFNMEWYRDNFVQMKMERDGDYNRFTIGQFRELDRAEKFLQDIQRMGIADAFIMQRVDGQLIGPVK